MKKLLIIFAVAAAFSSCNAGRNSDASQDDKDSIDAAGSSDSILQNELNADTSAKSDSTARDNTAVSDSIMP